MPPTTTATAPTTAQQPTAQAAPLAKSQKPLIERLRGSSRDPEVITAKLREAARHFHLVAPTTGGRAPEGCEVVFSPVLIESADTYEIPGSDKRGLAKAALDRIASAAGVSWIPGESRRLDDGSDPRYCHFRAVGRYRHFDGTVATIVAEKEMDLRDGSPQVESLIAKSAKKAKREAAQKRTSLSDADARAIGVEKAENQVRELRLHILGHAETKARLRAIRSLGIRTGYEPAELAKPFVVARVSFTGATDDPELRREFARAISQNFLNGHAALYGQATSALAPSLPVPDASRPLPPPPVSRARVLTESDEIDLDVVDLPAAPAAPPAQAQAAEPPAKESEQDGEPGDEPAIRFGSSKGVPLRDADDDDLSWYAGALAKSVADPEKARFKTSNERDLAAVRAEQKRRSGEDGDY